LTNLETPKFVPGVSLRPILENLGTSGHLAYSYFNNAMTVRTQTHRMTLHMDDYVELYDHRTLEKETKNIAN